MVERHGPDTEIARLVQASKVTDNTAQEVIEVTRDKVELALHRNLHKYVPGAQLLAWAGLTVTLLTTLLTADFQTTFWVSGDTWLGVFILALVISVFQFIRDLIRVLKRPSIDDLVDAIESDSRHRKGSA